MGVRKGGRNLSKHPLSPLGFVTVVARTEHHSRRPQMELPGCYPKQAGLGRVPAWGLPLLVAQGQSLLRENTDLNRKAIQVG